MSAIAGFVRLDGAPAAPQDIARMLEAMAAFRHADAQGSWHEGAAGLGHLLERRAPEDAFERQPLAGTDGRFILSGDFRLDNREELARALGLRAAELEHTPDSALVLGAWEKWGQDCPAELLGDFAFAIWDRHERVLFCVRDHVGIRPLYYTRTGTRLAFASAIKGLLALPDVAGRLDEIALADYLVTDENDLERTFYENVRRLPPSHILSLDAQGRFKLRRYWAPDPDFELRLGTDGEYAEGLREHLRRAVECRMRSTSASGVLLSGGLDSSTIACLAADVAARNGGRITAVASVLPEDFAGPERDEWQQIREAAASRPNIDVHRVTAPGAGLLTDLDEVLAINDQPFRDVFHYMTRALLDTAAGHGARNIFTGFGGDHVVSSWGSGYLAELCRRGRLHALWQEMQARQRLHGSPVFRQLKGQVLRPLLPAALVAWLGRRGGRGPAAHIGLSAIDAGFARRIGLEARLKASNDWGPPPRSLRSGEVRALMSNSIPELTEFLAQLSAAMGVAVPLPLLDKRLLEYCLALPARQKARDGWTRFALRRAMEGIVPGPIQWRLDKGPFSPDFDRRVSRDSPLVDEMVSGLEADAELSGYIDADKLRATMRDRPRYQADARWELETMMRIGAGLVALRFLQRRRAPSGGRPGLHSG